MTAPFTSLTIHPDAAGSAVAERIRLSLPAVTPLVAERPPPAPEGGPGPFKDRLFVKPFPGKFLKPCPGTSVYTCCGYRVLNLVTGCPLDCTYCILQLYLSEPTIVVHSNWEDALQEVDELIRVRRGKTLRIGTGELADSLALDPLTGMAGELLVQLLKRPEVVLELKTKTAAVDGLLEIDPRERAVVSWSLNAAKVVREEERGAPPLEDRLRAAAACRSAGYRIGLHFDPLVRFPGWESGYRRAVEAVYDYLRPGDIAWISLGALRYPPALDGVIRRRFPASPLPLGELVPGLDGKLRYFRPLRTEMFRSLYREIRKRDAEAVVYLCMESSEVWEESLGEAPPAARVLSRRLDEAVCPAGGPVR